MSIRIVRNEAGNCINFYGSSNPTYWNSCISGQVDPDDSTRVNVINDIQSAAVSETKYEFYQIPYTEFADRDGNEFADAQACADYITEEGNVIGVSDVGADLTGISVNFRLDQTTTSIIMDNGSSFGVNTIKAVADSDGTIHIHAIGAGAPNTDGEAHEHKYFEKLVHTNVSINGSAVSGGLQDVVNTLNELFTVGAFESVVIADPYSTMIADVAGTPAGYTLEGTGAVDPVGDDIFTNVSTGNYAGLKSTATIDQAGEYYTFDIRGEGQIGFGLVHTQSSYDGGYYSGNSTYANPTTFAVSNSAHYGFQFSHWFHPTPNGSWTNYGALTGVVYGPGWYNWESQDEWLAGDPVKIKVGIDENGYIAISSLQDNDTDWILHARSNYPVPQGSEFHLGIKSANPAARVYSAPKVHLLEVDSTPTAIGDDTIDVFGTGISGTIAGGIIATGVADDNDGFITTETISSAGEYFEWTWGVGDANVGLFSENDYNVSEPQGDTSAWGNNDYIFYGTRQENNGVLAGFYSDANLTRTVTGSPSGSYYGRVGIDLQGRPFVAQSADGVTWETYHHGNTSAPSGDYKFIWVAQNDNCDLATLTKGQLTAAPTMNFRYIESPDGNFQYPLFATTDEAEYYDQNHDGTTGSGTYHSHVFVDDATNTTWYMPDTGATMDGTAAPSGTFMSNAINWTEISSLSNADLVPTAFSDATIEVDELSAANIQVVPAGAGFTTTITDNDGAGVSLVGDNVEGTVPEVTGDNVANPSDDYTVTVTRTNSYGSSTGTLTIRVINLTAPVVVPITGFTHVTGSTALVDSDTLDDGSAVTIDDTVAAGRRFVINQSWVEANVLPALQAAGDKVYVGVADGSANWSSVDEADFDFFIRWDYSTATAHLSLLRDQDGGVSNLQTVNSLTDSYYDYAIEVDGTDVHLIACNANDINTQPAVNDGGSFSRVQTISSYAGTIPLTLTVAVVSSQMDIATSGLSEIDTPAAATNLTPWTKALDFSGSNEYALKVNTWSGSNPLLMDSTSSVLAAPSVAGNTANASNARPWATAIVFKYDGNSSNQHIWNSGEGAGSTDDNIYLRLDASGYLYLGWGRSGALNECKFLYLGTSTNTNHWHGIYIAHNGTRLSGTDATAANLADAFDIRWFTTNYTGGVFGSWMDNKSTTANWTAGSTGGRMDRAFTGNFTIGGRGSNRNFHGKVASMVITTLKLGVAMPTDAEIELMITDPKKWEDDYRIGQTVRRSQGASNVSYANSSVFNGHGGTQIWLMGDGTLDSYANGIRNDVYAADQNYGKLQLNSMVSNDIETINISGLT